MFLYPSYFAQHVANLLKTEMLFDDKLISPEYGYNDESFVRWQYTTLVTCKSKKCESTKVDMGSNDIMEDICHVQCNCFASFMT